MQNFYNSIQVMAYGMIGIFLFMIIFYFVTKGLDKVFPQKDDEDIKGQ